MDQKIKGGVAVIEKDKKHFLIRQSENKPLGGQWRHPGGNFEKDEEPIDGVKREIKEETGLSIQIIDEKPFHVEKIDYGPGYVGFYRAIPQDGELKIDLREISDYGWFSFDEIKNLNLMEATRSFYRDKYNLFSN